MVETIAESAGKVNLLFTRLHVLHATRVNTLPARIKVEEVAWYLGFAPHEITILMAEGHLKPLGRPPTTGVKYFSAVALEELRRDQKWLARASDCLVQYWKERNEKKAAHRGQSHDVPRVPELNSTAASLN